MPARRARATTASTVTPVRRPRGPGASRVVSSPALIHLRRADSLTEVRSAASATGSHVAGAGGGSAGAASTSAPAPAPAPTACITRRPGSCDGAATPACGVETSSSRGDIVLFGVLTGPHANVPAGQLAGATPRPGDNRRDQ